MKNIIVSAVAVLVSQVAFADVAVKTGFDYTSGTYGSNTRTEITSIPVIASYETGNWTFKATVPYIRITGADNVIAGVGVIKKNATSVRTASSLGDIVTAATYTVFSDAKTQFGVDVTGKIKLGTASSTQGLGTGKSDAYLLVDTYLKYGELTYFGGIGYGVLGSSSALPLKNVVNANAGVSYKLNEQASLGTMVDFRTKSTDTGFNQRELTAFYSQKFGGNYKLQAYASKGFSDGSPDYGAGMNIGYNF